MGGPPWPQARGTPVIFLLLLNVVPLNVIASSSSPPPSSAPGRKQAEHHVPRGLLLRSSQQHLGPAAAQLTSEPPVKQVQQLQLDRATEGSSGAVGSGSSAPARTHPRHHHDRTPVGTRPAGPHIGVLTHAGDATRAAATTAAAASAAGAALIRGFLTELPPSPPRAASSNVPHTSWHPAQYDTTAASSAAGAGATPLAGRRELRAAALVTPAAEDVAEIAPGGDEQAPSTEGMALGARAHGSPSMAGAAAGSASPRAGAVTLLADGPRGVLVLPDAENVTAGETPGAPAATGAAAQGVLASAEQQQGGQQAASPAALQLEQLQPDGSQQLPAAPPDVVRLALQQCSAARDPALQLLAGIAANGDRTAGHEAGFHTPTVGAQPPAEAGAKAAGAPQPSPVMLHPMASHPGGPLPPPAVPGGPASLPDTTTAPATESRGHASGTQGALLQGVDATGGLELVGQEASGGGASGGQADQLSALGMLMAVSQPGRCGARACVVLHAALPYTGVEACLA